MGFMDGNIHSLLSLFPLVIKYGDGLPPIIVTKKDDGVSMQWSRAADLRTYVPFRNFMAAKVNEAKEESARIEKEIITLLMKARMAEIRGDLRTAHQLRKTIQNYKGSKPPAILLGIKDDSPAINKADFDLLIEVEIEVRTLDEKLMKLSKEDNRDQYEKLEEEHTDKYFKFIIILENVMRKTVPRKQFEEPLAIFFRRIDHVLMDCEDYFDNLNIMPREWNVPDRIIYYLHIIMLQFHLMRTTIEDSQAIGDIESVKDAPSLEFDIFEGEWTLFLKDTQTNTLVSSQRLELFATKSP